ncbi:helix-turn-helix transcriptional regulator [Clostridium tyrobutyricum]|uniref:helix-turn-helix transcriptional regulator n=1 Tax=Clostridium tyrobutyricum TaxID=1519 RepID=UPI001C39591B|nr:helix-turn-helix transcriptional regulator [Clostridium tyrobutyricum]MBV4420171.1 helix-turn-helix transcriptional regulator [Clostridium tyrobutyricum]
MEYKLKAKRVEKGIKAGEFAKELGISPQYLCKIEKGSVEPKIKLALKICDLLGAEPKELFLNNTTK